MNINYATKDDEFSRIEQDTSEMLQYVQHVREMKVEYDGLVKRTLEMIKHMNCEIDIITFPVKLYHILHITPKYGLSHIISWENYGRFFQIKSRELFLRLITPM